MSNSPARLAAGASLWPCTVRPHGHARCVPIAMHGATGRGADGPARPSSGPPAHRPHTGPHRSGCAGGGPRQGQPGTGMACDRDSPGQGRSGSGLWQEQPESVAARGLQPLLGTAAPWLARARSSPGLVGHSGSAPHQVLPQPSPRAAQAQPHGWGLSPTAPSARLEPASHVWLKHDGFCMTRLEAAVAGEVLGETAPQYKAAPAHKGSSGGDIKC